MDNFTIINNSTNSMELIELALVRITGEDLTATLAVNTGAWCKEVSSSPRFARMPGSAISWIMGNDIPAVYQYLEKGHIFVDDAERRTERRIIERDKAHIFSIEFKGVKVDRSKTNAVVVCPVVIYAPDNRGPVGLICAGPTSTTDRYKEGSSFSVGNSSRYPLVPTKIDDRCRQLHFL
jgi:hypothetical protein